MSDYQPPDDSTEDDQPQARIPADDDLPEAVPPPITDADEPVPDADEPAPDADDFAPDITIPDDLTFDVPALDDLDVDVEGALASVATLTDVIAEREAEEREAARRLEAENREREEAAARRQSYYLPRPPLLRLQRGQMASVIPALLLMLSGAGLTVALAQPDALDGVTFTAPILALIVAGVLGALLVVQWLSSGRWAGGALFIGLTLWAGAGVVVFLAQPDGDGWRGWPLLLTAVGAAALFGAFLAQPLSRLQPFIGLALIVAGGVGYALTAGLIDYDFTPLAPALSAGAGIVVLLLLIVPIVVRRRG